MRKPSPYFSKTFQDVVLPEYLATFKNKRTAGEYFSSVCLMCDYLEKDFLEITESDAYRYYEYLLSEYYNKNLSRKTINERFASYRRLASFISDLKYFSEYTNPFLHVPWIGVDYDSVSVSNVIPMKELDMIMSAAKDDEALYLILALASRCAFTLKEIISLKTSMIEIDGDSVFINFPRKNDFSGIDVRKLPTDVSRLMIDYLNTAIIRSENLYIFYNKSGHPITARNVDYAVECLVKKSGVSKRYTIKDIRTRCIIDMSNAGVEDKVIAKYTNLSVKRIRNYSSIAYTVRDCPADLVNYQLK